MQNKDRNIDNDNLTKNAAFLTGTVSGEPEFWYKRNGEPYYRVMVANRRDSGTVDTIPAAVRMEQAETLHDGDRVSIQGEYHTLRRNGDDGKRHLFPHVFAMETREGYGKDRADLVIRGDVRWVDETRETPRGRKVRDMMLLAEAADGTRFSCPCIVWEKLLGISNRLKPGDHVYARGRFQSRIYKKTLADGSVFEKNAYEVSLWRLVKDENTGTGSIVTTDGSPDGTSAGAAVGAEQN